MLTQVAALLVVGFLAMGIGLAAGQAPAPATLSPLEAAQLENLQLRTVLAQCTVDGDGARAQIGALYQELGQLRAAAATATLTAREAQLKTDIEKAHPGHTFDPKTGILTKGKTP